MFGRPEGCHSKQGRRLLGEVCHKTISKRNLSVVFSSQKIHATNRDLDTYTWDVTTSLLSKMCQCLCNLKHVYDCMLIPLNLGLYETLLLMKNMFISSVMLA